MRCTGPAGVTMRALLAFGGTALVLVASTALLGVLVTMGTFASLGVLADVVPVLGPLLYEWADWIGDRLLTLVGASMVATFPWFFLVLVAAIRRERRVLLEETVPLDSTHSEAARSAIGATTRLAAQFDVPEPRLRLHSSSARFAYTTYRPEDPVVPVRRSGSPVVVVSTGLVDALSVREIEAVLAHEFAHLSNDDLQLTSWLLVPLLAAEFHYAEDDGEPTDSPFGRLLMAFALVSVGLFSRARELAADRAAATATGGPAALASALERLRADEGGRPRTDLRTHARTTNAISVLPVLGDDRPPGIRSTHPSLETRLAALRSLEE